MSTATEKPKPGFTLQAHEVELKDPWLAAFLAWLIPGAGHFYQGRHGKGFLFSVCILGTFVFGMYLGNGKVVYASMRPTDARYAYFCQVGVGLPAVPAMVQAYRVKNHRRPLLGGFMAPPNLRNPDQLSQWHLTLHSFFELGTVYTMIAGLLNVLAIFDAFAGPAPWMAPASKKKDPPPSPPGGSSGPGDPKRPPGAT